MLGKTPLTLTTAAIIAEIESGGDDYAMRYEPGWKYFSPDVIVNVMKANHCSMPTARALVSFSWGKFQIMGQVLYEQGFIGHFIEDFLNEPDAQVAAFERYLQKRGINFTPAELCEPITRVRFAERYNGTGNVPQYSGKIASILKHAGFDVRYHGVK